MIPLAYSAALRFCSLLAALAVAAGVELPPTLPTPDPMESGPSNLSYVNVPGIGVVTFLEGNTVVKARITGSRYQPRPEDTEYLKTFKPLFTEKAEAFFARSVLLDIVKARFVKSEVLFRLAAYLDKTAPTFRDSYPDTVPDVLEGLEGFGAMLPAPYYVGILFDLLKAVAGEQRYDAMSDNIKAAACAARDVLRQGHFQEATDFDGLYRPYLAEKDKMRQAGIILWQMKKHKEKYREGFAYGLKEDGHNAFAPEAGEWSDSDRTLFIEGFNDAVFVLNILQPVEKSADRTNRFMVKLPPVEKRNASALLMFPRPTNIPADKITFANEKPSADSQVIADYANKIVPEKGDSKRTEGQIVLQAGEAYQHSNGRVYILAESVTLIDPTNKPEEIIEEPAPPRMSYLRSLLGELLENIYLYDLDLSKGGNKTFDLLTEAKFEMQKVFGPGYDPGESVGKKHSTRTRPDGFLPKRGADRGNWNEGSSYSPGETVLFPNDGNVYISIRWNQNALPDLSPDYWYCLGSLEHFNKSLEKGSGAVNLPVENESPEATEYIPGIDTKGATYLLAVFAELVETCIASGMLKVDLSDMENNQVAISQRIGESFVVGESVRLLKQYLGEQYNGEDRVSVIKAQDFRTFARSLSIPPEEIHFNDGSDADLSRIAAHISNILHYKRDAVSNGAGPQVVPNVPVVDPEQAAAKMNRERDNQALYVNNWVTDTTIINDVSPVDGVTAYDPERRYEFGNLVSHERAVYQAMNTIQGIVPSREITTPETWRFVRNLPPVKSPPPANVNQRAEPTVSLDLEALPWYDPKTKYQIGAYVKYKGGIFQALKEVNNITPTIPLMNMTPVFWKPVGAIPLPKATEEPGK